MSKNKASAKIPDTHIRIDFAPDGRQRIHVEPVARLQERIKAGVPPEKLVVAVTWAKKYGRVMRLPRYFHRIIETGAWLGLDLRDSMGAALVLLTRASQPRPGPLNREALGDAEWWWVKPAMGFKVAHHQLYGGGYLPHSARTGRAIRDRRIPPQRLLNRMARFAFTALQRWQMQYFHLELGDPRRAAISKILSLAPIPGLPERVRRICNSSRDEKLEREDLVNTLFAHDPHDLSHMYVCENGFLKWDDKKARDKLDKVLGRSRARTADRGEDGQPRREAKPRRVTYMSPLKPEDEGDMGSLHDLARVEDYLDDLHELEAINHAAKVGLDRLKGRDHEMAEISMHIGLDGSKWGSRKHHRLLTEAGFNISADGLRKMVDRLRRAYGQP